MAISNSSDELQSLAQLGIELEKAGWIAPIPMGDGFDIGGDPDKRRFIQKALAFLKVEDARIRAILCEGPSVRPEVLAGGGTVGTIADALQALGGFPVPIWSIANVLGTLGLTKYCASSGKRP